MVSGDSFLSWNAELSWGGVWEGGNSSTNPHSFWHEDVIHEDISINVTDKLM